MPEGDDYISIAEILRQYLAVVLAADGLNPGHWGFARMLHQMTRRILERAYFHSTTLLPHEEAEVFVALEELHKCPLEQFGVPGTWWQVQERLRRVMPLAVRLVE